MPRQKLSEFRGKAILYEALGAPYVGWAVDAGLPLEAQLEELTAEQDYVLKVDEGVKGRFKKGLVKLGVKHDQITQAVDDMAAKGYHNFIIEPMVEHDVDDEQYLSLQSDRQGLWLQFTSKGGVDIEQHADSIEKIRLDDKLDWQNLSVKTGIRAEDLRHLIDCFKRNYFVFLEINPYLVSGETLQLLDAAVEVDDAAQFFVNTWNESDLRSHNAHGLTSEEKIVQELDTNSPASLKLSLLNPKGSIFLLLSGGGASVVVADEVYNQGLGEQLANYGEYSGNPNAEETYIYTKQLLQLLLKSPAQPKVLFIGGAVANFTDVSKTFSGVIKALEEVASELKAQKVRVFVRRGGPNQEAGLAKMKDALAKFGLLGAVHSPDTPLVEAVSEATKEVNHD